MRVTALLHLSGLRALPGRTPSDAVLSDTILGSGMDGKARSAKLRGKKNR